MEESDLHLHLSREASDPAAHQDETRFIVNQYRRMPERIWAYIWAADRRRAAVGACRNSFGCSATPAPMLATMSSGSAVRSSPGLIVEPSPSSSAQPPSACGMTSSVAAAFPVGICDVHRASASARATYPKTGWVRSRGRTGGAGDWRAEPKTT